MNNQAELSNMSNLLCGVDGSEPACRAAALAAQLASALDVKLTYLTVAREIEPRGDLKGYLEAEGLKGRAFASIRSGGMPRSGALYRPQLGRS
ncbi:MAG: hypothetical protein R3F54_23340 [Alphaproteobacteria bacterium]